MKTITKLLVATSVICAGSAQAAVVLSQLTFLDDINVVGGINLGGLDGPATTAFANGSDELTFQITIDDSGDTGAIFTQIWTMTGVDGAGNNEVEALGTGSIIFQTGAADSRQNTLTITTGALTETTATGAIATFDGFERTVWNLFGDTSSFTVAGDSYSGTAATNTALNLSPLVPSGSTFDITAGSGRMNNLRGQFTVTPVPEPSSIALLGLGCLGMAVRRRR